MNIDRLTDGILKGDYRSIARSISLVENSGYESRKEIISRIYRYGNAKIIGITGPPGVGKSTLIGNLAPMLEDHGKVSVLAIDPASPFSGGAILGNRIRMQAALTRRGIYMRSVSNRLYNGGLSEYTWDITKILEASGSDFVILETVGSGQADVDIMNIADITCVILAPGLGDEIQAIKSGMMEIGDIFVINKTDREGSYLAIKDIRESLNMSNKLSTPVIGLNSITGENYDEFVAHILKLDKKNFREKYYRKLKMVVMETIYNKYSKYIDSIEYNNGILDKDPYTMAEEILRNGLGKVRRTYNSHSEEENNHIG
ncbi:MAG: methylmalonyl Co-A mutase-associated GTPase MeaB [Candidatus Thermoplasmatota archaeon]|uniref:ArgK/MeaB family GTPase n=1 Tax=Ferroplasma sp. TaxID=2591003 RepID=UPI0026385739|nr:methylmalonyl Co-A mutase-associated GTPase MeaB [Ferroplasma sp.]MCL4311386.1 methylmalonyl Co-A mutase-associated GTPase MeaB [Candidatus Thermoplasmatota archaeon]